MSSKDLPYAWQAFHLPKSGNTAAEYEDAFAGAPDRGRFAVADGASESSFAASWASLLTQGFIEADSKPWHDLAWIAPYRQRWLTEVNARPVPWYAELKREQGAYSTFLGLAFRSSKVGEGEIIWRALAVGDSCLFSTRKGELLKAFPLERSGEFNNTPQLIPSRPEQPIPPQAAIHYQRGRCRRGDCFLLATDALAAWLLEQDEKKHQPVAQVLQLRAQSDPQGAFADWIETRRKKQGLRNDDVTLLIIDLL